MVSGIKYGDKLAQKTYEANFGELMMGKFVTLRLPRNDVGQIIDGLTERMLVWKTTEEYLETGHSHLGDFIEECSDPEESRFISQYYEKSIDLIQNQLKHQNSVSA